MARTLVCVSAAANMTFVTSVGLADRPRYCSKASCTMVCFPSGLLAIATAIDWRVRPSANCWSQPWRSRQTGIPVQLDLDTRQSSHCSLAVPTEAVIAVEVLPVKLVSPLYCAVIE